MVDSTFASWTTASIEQIEIGTLAAELESAAADGKPALRIVKLESSL
ncbi:hypothetical protein EKD04_019485 [Chloroflexales bacterium ZM16-3]|nr:hypothetical protein [Chloroflexales bacterium ZM16-3]